MRLTTEQLDSLLSLFPASFHGILCAKLYLNYQYNNTITATFRQCAIAIAEVRETHPDSIIDIIRALPTIIKGCGTFDEFNQDIDRYLDISDDLYDLAVWSSILFGAMALTTVISEVLYHQIKKKPAPMILAFSTIVLLIASDFLWAAHFYFKHCLGTGTCLVQANYDQSALFQAANVAATIAIANAVESGVHFAAAATAGSSVFFNWGKHVCKPASEYIPLNPVESAPINYEEEFNGEDSTPEEPSLYERLKSRC